MQNKNLAIILVIIFTIFSALAQLLWKYSTESLSLSIKGTILNTFLVLGFVTYAIGSVIFILALKKGELSMVFPFISLSFIWVALLSIIFLGETIAITGWIGIILIILGVSFVNRGSK